MEYKVVVNCSFLPYDVSFYVGSLSEAVPSKKTQVSHGVAKYKLQKK